MQAIITTDRYYTTQHHLTTSIFMILHRSKALHYFYSAYIQNSPTHTLIIPAHTLTSLQRIHYFSSRQLQQWECLFLANSNKKIDRLKSPKSEQAHNNKSHKPQNLSEYVRRSSGNSIQDAGIEQRNGGDQSFNVDCKQLQRRLSPIHAQCSNTRL